MPFRDNNTSQLERGRKITSANHLKARKRPEMTSSAIAKLLQSLGRARVTEGDSFLKVGTTVFAELQLGPAEHVAGHRVVWTVAEQRLQIFSCSAKISSRSLRQSPDEERVDEIRTDLQRLGKVGHRFVKSLQLLIGQGLAWRAPILAGSESDLLSICDCREQFAQQSGSARRSRGFAAAVWLSEGI